MQHFSELLDDLSQDALLGQLLSDPFLSGVRGGVEAMEGEDGGDLSPSSPLPPHITAEHSYSLCGDSRPQSPLSHLTGEQGSDAGETQIVGYVLDFRYLDSVRGFKSGITVK